MCYSPIGDTILQVKSSQTIPHDLFQSKSSNGINLENRSNAVCKNWATAPKSALRAPRSRHF